MFPYLLRPKTPWSVTAHSRVTAPLRRVWLGLARRFPLTVLDDSTVRGVSVVMLRQMSTSSGALCPSLPTDTYGLDKRKIKLVPLKILLVLWIRSPLPWRYLRSVVDSLLSNHVCNFSTMCEYSRESTMSGK